eukprot:m51a1_g14259 hypothetical protein (74) ;mRNA; r:295803-296098
MERSALERVPNSGGMNVQPDALACSAPLGSTFSAAALWDEAALLARRQVPAAVAVWGMLAEEWLTALNRVYSV